MMKRTVLALALALLPASALAQSSPGLVNGQVPTAGQWNSYFAAKQNTLGYTPVNKAGDVMLGRLTTSATAAAGAGFTLSPGTAPTSPINGDVWMTTAGVFARVNGTTVGPFTGPASGSFAGTSPITVSFPASVVTYACATCVTSSGGGAMTATAPVTVSAAGLIALNIGTGLSTSGSNLILTAPVTGTLGGTGVNNGASLITIGGNVTFSGAFGTTFTVSGTTSLTLPSGTRTLAALEVAQSWSGTQSFTSGNLRLGGASSGFMTLNCAAACGSNTITFPAGTTDFSATGGASNVLMQTSVGGAITVAQLAASNLSNGVQGSGAVVLATAPSVSSLTVTTAFTATGLVTNADLVSTAAYTLKGNFTGSSAAPQDSTIGALTQKVSPAAGDFIMLSDQSASGQIKYATVASVASAGSVASIAGNTGAFTLSNGITNSTNDIRLATIANKTALANISGGTAVPTAGNLATIGSSLVLLNSATCQSASASATIDFAAFSSSDYTSYIATYSAVVPATDGSVLGLRVGTGGTPTYQATGYLWGGAQNTDAATTNTGSTTNSATTSIELSGGTLGIDNGGSAAGGASGSVMFSMPASAIAMFRFNTTFVTSTATFANVVGGGFWNTATTLTAIRFIMLPSGNITSGTFCLYGIRNN